MLSWLRDNSCNWKNSREIFDQQQKEKDAESRMERAKELYIAGEMFTEEKNRCEKTLNGLQNTNIKATMTLTWAILTDLEAWDGTLPPKEKSRSGQQSGQLSSEATRLWLFNQRKRFHLLSNKKL